MSNLDALDLILGAARQLAIARVYHRRGDPYYPSRRRAYAEALMALATLPPGEESWYAAHNRLVDLANDLGDHNERKHPR